MQFASKFSRFVISIVFFRKMLFKSCDIFLKTPLQKYYTCTKFLVESPPGFTVPKKTWINRVKLILNNNLVETLIKFIICFPNQTAKQTGFDIDRFISCLFHPYLTLIFPIIFSASIVTLAGSSTTFDV